MSGYPAPSLPAEVPGGEGVASSHQSLSCSPPSNRCFVKEASFASNVVRGEGEGDLFVGLQKDDPGKWRCVCYYSCSCESRGLLPL